MNIIGEMKTFQEIYPRNISLDLNTSNNLNGNIAQTYRNGVTFEVPFLIVTCVLGYIGNFLVLLVYSRKKYRPFNAGLYILNLAVGKWHN